MCPMCIGGLVAMTSGVMSSGGVTALAWKRLGGKSDMASEVKKRESSKNAEGEKYESANAGK